MVAGTGAPLFKRYTVIDKKWGEVDIAIVDSQEPAEGLENIGAFMLSVFGTVSMWLGDPPTYYGRKGQNPAVKRAIAQATALLHRHFPGGIRGDKVDDSHRRDSGKIKGKYE